jgi:hypothetical protein
MLSVLFGPLTVGHFLTNVQGAVFYPLLGTMGILIPDSSLVPMEEKSTPSEA